MGLSSRGATALRLSCLALIVCQNSSLIIATTESRKLEPPYLVTTAVFLSELIKGGANFILLAVDEGSLTKATARCGDAITRHARTTVSFAIPALCYTLQNFLWYYALSHLDAVTAAVTSQMKVVTTAVASVIMLDRRLNSWQWAALVLLMCGLIVMQLRDEAAAGDSRQTRNSPSGAAAMLVSTVLSAYAGVFLERKFKTLELSLWLQSIQLSIFALPISALMMVIYDAAPLRRGHMMRGFCPIVWLAIGLNALGGVAVSMALKYADNIQKTFAVGVSIVLNCVVSAFFFDVPMTWRIVLGTTLVVGSTVLFAQSSRVSSRSLGPSRLSELDLSQCGQEGGDGANGTDQQQLQLSPCGSATQLSPRQQQLQLSPRGCAAPLSPRASATPACGSSVRFPTAPGTDERASLFSDAESQLCS